MRAARINAAQQQGLDDLIRELRTAGYTVEVVAPGQGSTSPVDLQVEVETSPAAQVLENAAGLARQGYDVFVAPGLGRPEGAIMSAVEQQAVAPKTSLHDQPALAPLAAESQAEPPAGPEREHANGIGEVFGAALSRSSRQIGNAWEEFLRKRAVAAEQRRLERELRDREREARRQQEALALRHRMQQEERLRAERLRLEREQMAREAAIRAERAQLAEEQERRRVAGLEAERARLAQQREMQRLASVEVQNRPAPARPQGGQFTAAAPPRAAASPAPRPVYPARRIPSPRQQQWQRAAFLASLVALTAMLGFAAAVSLRPASPLPSSVLQNRAQQSVPFGSASMPATATSAPVRPATTAAVPPHKTGASSAARKPSPQKPAHRTSRRYRAANDAAPDEVVVRHYRASGVEHAQSSGTLRKFSDEN